MATEYKVLAVRVSESGDVLARDTSVEKEGPYQLHQLLNELGAVGYELVGVGPGQQESHGSRTWTVYTLKRTVGGPITVGK